jgi:hypothetical protein
MSPTSAKNGIAVLWLIPLIDIMISRSSIIEASHIVVINLLIRFALSRKCTRVATFPYSMISFAALTIPTEVFAALIMSWAEYVSLVPTPFLSNASVTSLGFAALMRRTEGNFLRNCNITFVDTLHMDSNATLLLSAFMTPPLELNNEKSYNSL